MKRKVYEKPTMHVVELQQRSHILVGSTSGDVNATMNGTFVEEDI
jgi:hypothetical protein